MADEHNAALYRDSARVYAVNGDLRKVAIRLWNRGAVILHIQDMEDANTCWGSYKKGEPAGYLIGYAFRRKLPV